MCNFGPRALLGSRSVLDGAAVLLAGRLEPVDAPSDPRTVAARARFFGADTVDPDTGAVRADRVVLSWVGCTTYALAIAGSVFLLDAWVPRLTSTGFCLVWHDSAGPLTEKAPHVFAELSALPPTDLQIGAVQGFNQITNGLRDPRRYIEAIRPALFVPSHHDNWFPGITASAAAYDTPLTAELARIAADDRPELRTMHDPADYVSPERLTFPL